MKSLRKFANGIAHKRVAILRSLDNIVSSPALANHTPAGPGSLATGQVTGARRGTAVRPCPCGSDQRATGTHPTPVEFSMPLRQVFWI